MFACIHAKNIGADVSLADFAYAFSPLVEETEGWTVVIDVEGCELLFGSAYELANEIARRAATEKKSGGLGCKVNVAIAANPDAAIFAAKFYRGISFISPGEELTGLGSIPISNLRSQISNLKTEAKTDSKGGTKTYSEAPLQTTTQSKSEAQALIKKSKSGTKQLEPLDFGHLTLDQRQLDEILETLRLWGIETFGEFAALPVSGISERLGQAGVKLQQLVGGKTERQLKLKQPALVFAHSLELDYPLSELEPLSFIFARLLNQLCAMLNAYALATNELRVQLKLENLEVHERVLNLPHPMRDNKIFLKLLLLDTEMHPPASAVSGVSISCEPVKPRFLQNGLFIPLAPEPEKLELTLLRLAKLLGAENVGAPELIDTHRPDAFRIKRFVLKGKMKNKRDRKQSRQSCFNAQQCLLGFRAFRPPLRAMVEATNGYPTQVSAWSKKLSVYGRVVRLAGPWRTTGEWWRSDSWARDEWDVAVESGRGATSVNSRPGGSTQALYRIYRELANGSWFVEGSYD